MGDVPMKVKAKEDFSDKIKKLVKKSEELEDSEKLSIFITTEAPSSDISSNKEENKKFIDLSEPKNLVNAILKITDKKTELIKAAKKKLLTNPAGSNSDNKEDDQDDKYSIDVKIGKNSDPIINVHKKEYVDKSEKIEKEEANSDLLELKTKNGSISKPETNTISENLPAIPSDQPNQTVAPIDQDNSNNEERTEKESNDDGKSPDETDGKKMRIILDVNEKGESNVKTQNEEKM